MRYASDGGDWYSRRRNLDKNDLFPALNLKYAVNPANSIRFSASRTVTRPSFIEMAPFLYQESYGSAPVSYTHLGCAVRTLPSNKVSSTF